MMADERSGGNTGRVALIIQSDDDLQAPHVPPFFLQYPHELQFLHAEHGFDPLHVASVDFE
jgi:hypothetical protein